MKDKKIIIILVAVILVVMLGSVALLGYLVVHFTNVDGKIYNQEDLFENVESFKIVVANSNLDIFPGEGDKVKVIAENVKGKYTVQQNGNTLEIREGIKGVHVQTTDSKIVVYVPQDTIINTLEVENGAGALVIGNLEGMILNIEQGAGKLTLGRVDFSMVDIEAGVGEIDFSKSVCNTLNIDAGVGKLKMDDIRFNRCKLEAGIGDVSISLAGPRENYKLNIEKGLGTVTIDGKTIPGNVKDSEGTQSLDIECGVGNVDLDFFLPKNNEF